MVPLIWNYPINYPISLMATDILNPDGRLEIQQTFGNRDSYEILYDSALYIIGVISPDALP